MGVPMLWFAATIPVLVFTGMLLVVVRRLLEGSANAGTAARRIEGDYYKPMARLLAEEEFRRVVTAGFSAQQVNQLRASRRRVFRQYLTELQGDFRALHQEARELLRDSQDDRPDLAVELVRQYAAFHYRVAVAHCQLAADSFGWPAADTKALVEPVQWMHQQWELLRAPMPSAI